MSPLLPLAIVSFLTLFYELTFIRWLPGNVTSLAYFANIVLISTFFGLGLGYLAPARRRDLFPLLPAALLGVVGAILLLRTMGVLIPANAGEWIWSSFTDNIIRTPTFRVPLIPALGVIFVLNALVFVPLGQKTRNLMESVPILAGYSINVAGSIAGVVVFSLFSIFYRDSLIPVSWFALGGLLTLPVLGTWRQRALALASTALVCGAVAWGAQGERWSPYYVTQLEERPAGAFRVFVNKFFHQEAVNFDRNPAAAGKYGAAYALTVPRRLLVLGAGSGNDVAAALRHGVAEIDAVEIDPEIVAIGRARHPQRPYDDPRVRVHVDDARSFLKRTDRRYDMVILGTLDSHALLSGMSTIRLDNFVYTRECLEDVKRRLAPEGVAVLLYSVPQAWLGERLTRMAATVFPGSSYRARIADPYLFNLMIAAGPGTARLIYGNPRAAGFFQRLPVPAAGSMADIPSDDWPYLYLSGRRIPTYYLVVIAVLLAITAASVIAVSGGRAFRFNPAFFFTGCAFLLLETKSVTTLSLLFGSTWSVNAAVFVAIMAMILLANLTVGVGAVRDLRVIGACLLSALALNWLVPLEFFLRQPTAVKWLVPSVLVALPIYFAGILFARLLADASDVRTIYGSNLIGCVVGGFVEYASMVTGLRFLFVLAALCYVAALLAARGRSAAAGA